jgi:hypothetical protein
MSERFFERPILNSPYEYPQQHWELDEKGQPTNRIIETRRRSDLITPVPKPKKRRQARADQSQMLFGDLSTEEQEYNPTPIINEVRTHVATWRNLPNPDQWMVTPETARLLMHWRHHPFQGIRPFFCQIEAVETAIWLSEVAPKMGTRVAKFRAHIEGGNEQANPELLRLMDAIECGIVKLPRGVPGRRGDGLRRRGDPVPGANRDRDRRVRPRGGLQHRTPPPLRRLHPRPGPPDDQRRGACIRVPGRSEGTCVGHL